jgi:hypothetical protein
MLTGKEIHSMYEFWKIVREDYSFGNGNACGETLP